MPYSEETIQRFLSEHATRVKSFGENATLRWWLTMLDEIALGTSRIPQEDWIYVVKAFELACPEPKPDSSEFEELEKKYGGR